MPLLSPHLRRWLLPWLLAVAALANLAYPMYVHYDFSHSLDTRSYLRMASGRFDSVNVTRRYRVLVPAAAASVAAPISQLYAKVWPQRPAGQWPLRFGFYLVNCLLLGAAGTCWFNAARLAGAAPLAAGLAMLAVLSSRWAEYAAGLPLTDSLYLLVFGLGYYGVRRRVGGGWAIALSFMIGPLAKESFLFLVPWLLWFARPALSVTRQLVALAVGLGMLFTAHHLIDSQLGIAADQSVANALSHAENIRYSLLRAASPKGIGELLSIFGLFTFVPLLALARQLRNPAAVDAFSTFGAAEIALLAVVGAHMLLSGDLGRMGYLAAPVFCALLALIFTRSERLVQA